MFVEFRDWISSGLIAGSPFFRSIFIIIFVAFLIYKLGTLNFDYFSDQGIAGPRPLPFVGNLWGVWKENVPHYDRRLVKRHGRMFGYFQGNTPDLWTTDPELIKSVLVKDFPCFINRRAILHQTKIIRKMLVRVHEKDWKDVRSAVTPAFTSGKIKKMSLMMKQCADSLSVRMENAANDGGKADIRTQFLTYSLDVIARSAFGISIDNLEDKNDPFVKSAMKAMSFVGRQHPIYMLHQIYPNLLCNLFGSKILMTKEIRFFTGIMEEMIKNRRQSNEGHDDLIDLLFKSISRYVVELTGRPKWNSEEIDEMITAQSVTFLFAGYDTSSMALTCAVFLLARNPEVQEKLYNAIVDQMETFDEINHDMVANFPYLECVIREVLRMYPPVPKITRVCNKDVTYDQVHIRKGTLFTVPTYALHYDEEFYPDPYTFNPDRWDGSNDGKMHQYTWMPFGSGPRNCVGMRFAMEEMKIALCNVVKKFRFFAVAETPEEMQFEDGFVPATLQPCETVVGIELRH